jgi:hypothetical protein
MGQSLIEGEFLLLDAELSTPFEAFPHRNFMSIPPFYSFWLLTNPF